MKLTLPKVLPVVVALGVATSAAESPDLIWWQQADTTITIRATGSTLEFQPPNISAKHGSRVRIRFVNEGTLPHNFVVPRTDDDIDALALAAYQSGASDFVPVEQKDKMVAYTKLASPGETVEATFVVPPPGDYTYVCLFPGHANTMLGKLRALR